jgi:hypothetical protein
MSDLNNEGNQEALSGLNDEDKKILEDLKKEGHEVEGLEPSKPEAKEEPKEEPKELPEPEKQEEDDKPKQEKPKGKEPSLMPRWEHEVAEKRHEKEKAELQSKIEELQSQSKEGKPAAEIAKTADDIREFAEKYNADPEAVEALIAKVVEKATGKLALPKEVQELIGKLPEVNEITQSYKETVAEGKFNQEFERDVKPLVEKEFPGITEAELQGVKSRIRELAVTEEYQRTGLHKIYKAEDEFRTAVSPKRKSADGGRSGRTGPTLDLEHMSAEDAASLTGEDFIKWSDLQAEKERKH